MVEYDAVLCMHCAKHSHLLSWWNMEYAQQCMCDVSVNAVHSCKAPHTFQSVDASEHEMYKAVLTLAGELSCAA